MKTAELYHCGYVVRDRFANVLKITTDVLNALERPEAFLVEPLQTMFDLVIYTFPGEEVLKEEKNRNW